MNRRGIPAKLPVSAIGAAILIVAVWGFNFVVIKIGVSAMPLPAPTRSIATYGLLLGVGEFGLFFTPIKLGAPSGLFSILLQSQAFFTAVGAALVLGGLLIHPFGGGFHSKARGDPTAR
ncbi:MAG: hypothetical protein Q8M76_11105 [Spirochaetaceae bacterium]|nr:hypothetical protein [Spirochaetaceae bacterium]